ncbi:hypothetical protein KFK09_011885 [Dendrobium nobile]|uniref:Uncharacterized protein n=1 Tax=Dendrobium nobile TaxID=94219 RepID=A0A8T3BG54_DENNO|nr:hypothetical protein KFK09_011885 [Dendrobium nobile]
MSIKIFSSCSFGQKRCHFRGCLVVNVYEHTAIEQIVHYISALASRAWIEVEVLKESLKEASFPPSTTLFLSYQKSREELAAKVTISLPLLVRLFDRVLLS